MNIDEAIVALGEKYTDTSRIEFDNFREWVADNKIDDDRLSYIVRTIIKNDNRQAYKKILPELTWIADNVPIQFGSRPLSAIDPNSLDYIKELTRAWPVKTLYETYISIFRGTPRFRNKNHDIDFLHWWHHLYHEAEFGRSAGWDKDRLRTHLEVVKTAILSGGKYRSVRDYGDVPKYNIESPYTSDRK